MWSTKTKIIIAAILVTVVPLARFLKAEMSGSQERRNRIENQTLPLPDQQSKREKSQLQEYCARQAERTFRLLGYEGHYQSHFSEGFNKCFMTVDVAGTLHPLIISKFLYDANERKVYAQIQLTGNLQNPPDSCTIRLDGKMTQCKSLQEYEAFVARVME